MSDTVEYYLGEKRGRTLRIWGREHIQPVQKSQENITGLVYMGSAIAAAGTKEEQLGEEQRNDHEIRCASMDIGRHAHSLGSRVKEMKMQLGSSEQALMSEVENQMGTRQVARKYL